MSSLSQFNSPERLVYRLSSQVTSRILRAGLVLGLTSLMLTGVAPMARADYADIPSVSPSAKYVNYLSERHIISGYPDHTFRPYKPVTRAEFAVMLAKSQQLPVRAVPQTGFRDVSKRHWASGAIAAVSRQGWLKGYPGKTFRPNRRITRAEVYTVMAKLGQSTPIGLPEAEALLNRYRDSHQIPAWAKIPLAIAIQAGLTTDDIPSQTVWPNVNASRADVATVLAKLSNADFRVAAGEPVAPVNMSQPASTPTLQLKPAPVTQTNWLHELSEDIILNEPATDQVTPPVLAKPIAKLRRPASIRKAHSQNQQQVVGLYFSNLDNLANDSGVMIGAPAMRYFKGPNVPQKAIQALLSGPTETERKHGYFVDEEVSRLKLIHVNISKEGVASVVLESPEDFTFKSPQAPERLKEQVSRTLRQFSQITQTELSISSGGPKTVSQTSP